MRKFILAFGLIIGCTTFAVAQEEDLQNLVEYGNTNEVYVPEIKVLEASEDDLYDGGEIKPLSGRVSATEKMQKNSGDLTDDPENKLPELNCADSGLLKQVGAFIYEYVRHQSKKSVPQQRAQLLLVKNMHEFTEITEQDLKQNFSASAALMYLKLNQNREIYKICASKDNNYKQFNNVYVIIYPYLNYYNIVVTNLISDPEKMADATFVFNW